MSFSRCRNRVRYLTLVALTLAVVSCRGDGGAGDSGTGWLAGAGKPVDLALTFDPASGAAKVITPRGGSVSTRSADGTLYRLELPEGALLSDERISMIPVTAIKGLPLKGGSLAAVHLKPEGLRLLKPATLHIRARTDVPVAERVGFAYFENGKDAHLYPLTLDRTRIEMPIFHFSGYGYGKAPLNDPGRIALQHAASKEARLHSKIAEILARQRAKPLLGTADDQSLLDWTSESKPLGTQYLREVVLPLMKIAETNERMYECAITKYLAWERQKAVLGCAEHSDAVDAVGAALGGVKTLNKPRPGSSELQRLEHELAASAARAAQNKIKKMFQPLVKRCKAEHDMHAAAEVSAMMLLVARQMALLGSEGSSSELDQAYDRAREEMKKCLSFELEFRSMFETKTADGEITQHYHVHAQVPISAEFLGGADELTPELVRGTAPLKYISYSSSSVSANRKIRTRGVGTRESALTVFGLAFARTREKMEQTNCVGQDEWQERFVADTVRVTLSPGKPVELVQVTTPWGSTVNEGNAWLNFWQIFRAQERETSESDASATSDDESQSVDSANEAAEKYVLPLRKESPGVWRADFESMKRDAGYELEDSYVVLRHRPK